MAEYEYTITSQNLAIPFGRDKFISDLGITIYQELKFINHINEKINKANGMLGVIKRHFKYITPETLILLYKSMVRTHMSMDTRFGAHIVSLLSSHLRKYKKELPN